MPKPALRFVLREDTFVRARPGPKGRGQRQKEPESRSKTLEPREAQRSCVLVIDDDALIREAMYAALEDFYDVVALPDGDELLDMVAAYDPDLLVLDINLPGQDGFGLCESIRSTPRFRDLPVLFMTVRRDDNSFIRNLEVDGDAYLTKPFDPKELVDTVRRLLRAKGEGESP